MSTVRAVAARVWRPAAAAVVVGAGGTVAGLAPVTALVLAAAAAALVVVAEHVDLRAEPSPGRRRPDRRDGSRGEVLDLAWSMVGRDGRAGERSLRRLRAAGARRLARHGTDLADPDRADEVRRLVGDRAHATLTRTTHPLPTLADVDHTLRALEALGPDRHPRAAPPAPPPHQTSTGTPRSP